MRARLDTDGYAMIRSFLSRDDVDTAYDFILQSLRERLPLAPKGPIQKNIGLINRQDVATAEPLRRITEHKSLYELLERLLGEEVITTGFKWLRAVGIKEFTGVHMDRVFLGGSSRMLTVWIPISKCPTWCGPIMVARGSHKDPAYAEIQRTYGESKVGADGTASGWLYDDGSALARDLGREVEWKSANFWPGDILILDSRVLHMTATNVSEEMRISCDTRWQPRSDPRDPKITSWHAQPPDMPPAC
ncbi:hypothetical protein WJX75_000110 [Coccomyxa subellipsoidea]|uniref:PhyH-domain-containing protein n=1 Tax=Coccomyxa subellipsoidea TaxID=248742 RepID=A0ABR2YZ95_9CHLO